MKKIYIIVIYIFVLNFCFLQSNIIAADFDHKLWGEYLNYKSSSNQDLDYDEWLRIHNDSELRNDLKPDAEKEKKNTFYDDLNIDTVFSNNEIKSKPDSEALSGDETIFYVPEYDADTGNDSLVTEFSIPEVLLKEKEFVFGKNKKNDELQDLNLYNDTGSIRPEYDLKLNTDIKLKADTESFLADKDFFDSQQIKLLNLNADNSIVTKKNILLKIDEYEYFLRKKNAFYFRIPAAIICLITLL